MESIAIMQPYAFPYIGYFHLIEAGRLFVFYDDVHYIKQGWINRNRILLNGKDHLFTIPVSHGSSYRLINETPLASYAKWKDGFHKTIIQAYRKAPFFLPVVGLIETALSEPHGSVSDLAISSVAAVYQYLGRSLNYSKSSVCSPETKGMDTAERLIEICKRQGFSRYVNAPGGETLYAKPYFAERGVELGFVKSAPIEYRQFSNTFVPWLSIIDVLMFNDIKTVLELLGQYSVV